jgi:hypothetical protein
MSPPTRSPAKGVCKVLQTVSNLTFEICDVPFQIQLFAHRRRRFILWAQDEGLVSSPLS